MKNYIKTSVVSIIVIVVSAVLVVFSGAFNVSAGWEDPPLFRWFLVSTREASIEVRARDIVAPELGGLTQIRNGFRSYREMCAVCHTPPGYSDTPVTQGLNPSPTDLTKTGDHAMSDAELFWVIKNGIRMTGMPAWGVTHGDDELWDIVAFVKALPGIDAKAYRQLDSETSPGHGHSNDTGHDQSANHMDHDSETEQNHVGDKMSSEINSHMGGGRHEH